MASTSPAPEPGLRPPDEEVRDALNRIAGNQLFAGSERLTRFLRYVVQEQLAGRGQAIKEYNIGVEVYGRPPDYDPKIDATVRVEAGRLRAKLAKYYAAEGAAQIVRIELPRGTYVPVFHQTRAGSPAVAAGGARMQIRTRLIGGAILGLAIVTGMAWWLLGAVQDRSTLSIAVLPLTNASGDADGGRFAQGLTGELTSAIASGDVFRVANRTESDQFRNATGRLAEVAAKLRINAVIEGSVQSDPGRLRATVQLVTPRSGQQVWSQTYESLPARREEFQAKVSYLIARTLRARFAGIPETFLGGPPSRNSEAVTLYQKGNELWLTQRRSALEESAAFYQQAIRKDAGFARPYEGLAASELFLASLDFKNAGQHLARAKTAALKAIALDDRLADPHARLGNIFLRVEWNFVRAEEELQRSVILEPGSSAITRWYSEAARLREKYADARSELEYGLMANPHAEMIETELGLLDVQLERLPDAEMHLQHVLASQPDYRLAHMLAGVLLERAGKLAEAEDELRAWSNMTEFGQQCLAALGHVYGMHGNTSQANQVAQQLEGAPRRSMSLAALVYLGMGDRERAFNALDQAYMERDPFLPLIKNDPRFRVVQSDPRFRGLMERLGLPGAVF
jgi:TolB-like protein/Flp pilus assembly protein TadD